METNIEKVNRRTVADQVFHIILKKISSGEWKIGEKIPSEIELAQDLGVSRTTLKMALQKLNTLGMLETRVGAANLTEPMACKHIIENMPAVMERYGINNITDIIGGAHHG